MLGCAAYLSSSPPPIKITIKKIQIWSDLKNSNGFGILDPKNRKCEQK